MTNQAHQIFCLIYEFFYHFFRENPSTTEWKGTATQLHEVMAQCPESAGIKGFSPVSIGRILTQYEKTGRWSIDFITNGTAGRKWIIPRAFLSPKPTQPPALRQVWGL